jgi:hypothetical protein
MRTHPSRVRQSKGLSSEQPEPYLRFYHSKALRNNSLSLLRTIEQAEDATTHRDALADVVVELTNSGLDYYFMQPLKRAKAGFVVQQAANLGLTGVQHAMGSVMRGIIGRMDRPQLLSVCSSIRKLML